MLWRFSSIRASIKVRELARVRARGGAKALVDDPTLDAVRVAHDCASRAGARVGACRGLHFGEEFATFSRRTYTVCVMNLTGIPTDFHAYVERYPVAQEPGVGNNAGLEELGAALLDDPIVWAGGREADRQRQRVAALLQTGGPEARGLRRRLR